MFHINKNIYPNFGNNPAFVRLIYMGIKERYKGGVYANYMQRMRKGIF